MNKNKLLGMVLGVVGLVILIGGLYLAISYVGTLMKTMIDFISSNNDAISRCGINVPERFVELSNQFATNILPMLYLGIPLAVVLIAVVMFASGYFFGKGALQDELDSERKKKEEIDSEVRKRVGKRTVIEEPEEEESEEEYEEEEKPKKKGRK